MKAYLNFGSLITIVLVGGLLLYGTIHSSSTQEGTPEGFIAATCSDHPLRKNGSYPKISGLTDHFYYKQRPHDRVDYRVNPGAMQLYLDKNFPNAVKISENGPCKGIMRKSQNASNFLANLNEISIEAFSAQDNKASLLRFERRVKQSYKKWFTFAFELIFICCSIIGVFLKKREGKFVISAERYFLFPIIFLLPHYFGYCSGIYSTIPTGGLLYPLLAMIIGLPFLLLHIAAFEELNNTLVSMFPQFLGSLEMDRGEWLSGSGPGGIPIIELFLAYATIIAIVRLFRYFKEGRTH